MKKLLLLLLFFSLHNAIAQHATRCNGLWADEQRAQLLPTAQQPLLEQMRAGFIEGDGIGSEIMPVTLQVVNAAVHAAYGGRRQIIWEEVSAGEKALATFGENLPQKSLDRLRALSVVLKGPMNTPTGGGFRSLNVALRQQLCLYACVRPVKKYPNVPSPLTNADRVDIVIFRENTEDVYAGFEFLSGTPEAQELIAVINRLSAQMGASGTIATDASIGIKPMTKAATERLMRRALQFAIQNSRPSVTIVHKGNIQKFTEGAFRQWAYELALTEFRDHIVTETELYEKYDGHVPKGKIVLNDRIADNMFQQTILYPERYSVLVTPNLNGDYLSDQIAALVGGLGIAPGANIGDNGAIFEATHGTAPDIAGKNLANPSSLILSAVMMLEYMGWNEAAVLIEQAITRTFNDKIVTGDFRKLAGAHVVGTKEFAQAIIERLQ